MASVCGGLLFAVHKSALNDNEKFFLGLLGGAALVFCILVLGGPKKLFMDWFDRNFWGYYWVLRRTGQNALTGEFVNDRHLNLFTRDEWTLHIPVGGWFNRPFFRHDGSSSSSSFRITRVRWDSVGQVESITVQDRMGNRLTHHPAWFLERLSGLLRTDFSIGTYDSVSRLAMVDANRLMSEKRAVAEELDAVKAKWKCVSDVVCAQIRVMEGWLHVIDSGTRLRTTREGSKMRHLIGYEVSFIKHSTAQALHPESLTKHENSAA
ncbi:MAG: hypothetical protein IT406_01030 [Candidatus Yanofskybacteria bacterium]|nr:hypothetical protein [Candidatus Yanofskybacteria bacterium]